MVFIARCRLLDSIVSWLDRELYFGGAIGVVLGYLFSSTIIITSHTLANLTDF